MGASIARNRDDEPLPPQEPKTHSEGIVSAVNISLDSSKSYIIPSITESTEVIGCLTLEGKLSGTTSRTGVDLVCVIDVSGSMSGEKIKLVKTTLGFMLTQLGERDRVSLVTFSNSASRLCKLTRMTEAGKKRINAIISGITADGGTEMVAGLEYGLCALAGRRYFNETSAILILTDGIDNNSSTVLHRSMEMLEKVKINREFTIHTFGYGSDHDSALLTALSDKKNGGFYYVERFETIAEAFASCLGEVVSMIAENIQVSLETLPCEVPFALAKVFSDTGDNSFKIQSLIADNKKEAIFVLNVLPIEMNENEITIKPLKAIVSYRDIKNDQEFKVEKVLEVRLKKEKTEEVKINNECVVNYYRFKAAEALKLAGEKGDLSQMNEAREILDHCAEEIKQSEVANEHLAQVLAADLESSKARFVDYHEYNSSGKHQILKKARGHFNKRGEDIECYNNFQQMDMIVESKAYFSSHQN